MIIFIENENALTHNNRELQTLSSWLVFYCYRWQCVFWLLSNMPDYIPNHIVARFFKGFSFGFDTGLATKLSLAYNKRKLFCFKSYHFHLVRYWGIRSKLRIPQILGYLCFSPYQSHYDNSLNRFRPASIGYPQYRPDDLLLDLHFNLFSFPLHNSLKRMGGLHSLRFQSAHHPLISCISLLIFAFISPLLFIQHVSTAKSHYWAASKSRTGLSPSHSPSHSCL